MSAQPASRILGRAAWLAAFSVGWVIVRALVQAVVRQLMQDDSVAMRLLWNRLDVRLILFLIQVVGAVVIIATAWTLARFALRLGAPAAIWAGVAAASIPFAILSARGLYSGEFGWWVIIEVVQAAAPPAVMLLEARRQRPRPVLPAAVLLEPSPSSGT